MIYRIDRNDELVYADGAFRRFAREAELGDGVVGQSLWDFIGDPELSALHRALVSRARQGHRISIRTRGKSMGELEFTFVPLEDGAVELYGREVLSEELTPSDGDMLRICAWCYRAERDGWHAIEDVVTAEHLLERPAGPFITHGICDACLATLHAELDAPARA